MIPILEFLKNGDEPGRYNLSCINQQVSYIKRDKKNTASIKAAAPIIWIRRVHRDNL